MVMKAKKSSKVVMVTKTKKKIAAVPVKSATLSKEWTPKEEAILRKLNTPEKIQAYIDSLGYDGADDYYSVRSTLKTHKAHCMGGALVAACCLERLGFGRPRIMGFEAENDDSHAIAVYQKNGYWGAVAKSNFTLIRSRQPVYKTVRELMMSYFDFYFNTKREMSMTHYLGPYNLNRAGHGWKFKDGSIGHDLDEFDDTDRTPLVPIRPPGIKAKHLGLASKAVLRAGLIGANPAGLYKPN